MASAAESTFINAVIAAESIRQAAKASAFTTYGYVDQTSGVARIPIDRAISIVLEKGLGTASDKKREAK